MSTVVSHPQQSTIDDGWSLSIEPPITRTNPMLAPTELVARSLHGASEPSLPPPRTTPTMRMCEIDDGWVLADERVNLNTASASELQALPGVGHSKAGRIVSWRERNGRFADVTELANVSGFGPKSVAKLADQLTI